MLIAIGEDGLLQGAHNILAFAFNDKIIAMFKHLDQSLIMQVDHMQIVTVRFCEMFGEELQTLGNFLRHVKCEHAAVGFDLDSGHKDAAQPFIGCFVAFTGIAQMIQGAVDALQFPLRDKRKFLPRGAQTLFRFQEALILKTAIAQFLFKRVGRIADHDG